MEILNCVGLDCPEPVLRTKKQLETHPYRAFAVRVDNEASRENVLRFGKSQGCEVSVEEDENDSFLLTLIPKAFSGDVESFNEEEYLCELPVNSNLVYVISSDSMGSGSEELGWALLQTYIATIGELAPLPSHLLMYNGGVKLVTSEGRALEAIQELEKKGVIVRVCGTCLEFFELEKEQKAGSVTNMYEIMDTMATAGKLVSPF